MTYTYYMKPLVLMVALAVLLSSCATFLNERNTTVNIHSNKPSAIVYEEQTIPQRKGVATVNVLRSKDPLVFTVISDSVSKQISINSKNSVAYLYNIIGSFGLGLLVDKDNPKRYTYPAHVYVDVTDTSTTYINNFLPGYNKGDFYLNFSIPELNWLIIKPDGETAKKNLGFLGLSIGVDYYHIHNQFLNLTAGANLTASIPFPAPVDQIGEHEILYSTYLSLSNNHRINRFSVGYGLSYTGYNWKYVIRESVANPTRTLVTKHHTAMGLTFPAYFRLSKSFHIGALYRPTFIRFNTADRFCYEHALSLDLIWKFKL